MKKLIICGSILLVSCNQAFYKHYSPYTQLGYEINKIQKQIRIDVDSNLIDQSLKNYYVETLDTLRYNLYRVSYEAKKPLLMPFKGRFLWLNKEPKVTITNKKFTN
tara:strand:+ start:260 stop:577 length:318 start_codon:yes stop_codon:yes gene_type:complete